MIFGPLAGGLLLGAAQTGLNLFGASAQAKAQAQDYKNAVAYQNANTTFARWQATFNKRITDENNRYNYWQETVNYNQNLAYTRSLKNYELVKAYNQADVVEQTRSSAGADYILGSEAIGQAYAERSMQDAVALMQYNVAALKARSTVEAKGQEGLSIDRLLADYDRQVGDYQTLQQINQGFTDRQYTREQAGQLSQYLSRYNSQPFYEEQPYMDPIAPFQPLPALLEAPAPTMTGAPPSGMGALQIGSSILSGVNTGLGMYGQLKSFTSSGKVGAQAVASQQAGR